MTFCIRLLSILSIAVLTVACSGKKTSETGPFQFRELTSEDGNTAAFDLDMTDSTCLYSVSVTARFLKQRSPDSVRADITLFSPSGQIGIESITLPSNSTELRTYLRENPEDSTIKIAGTSAYYDVRWLYRSDIRPSERGIWNIRINMTGAEESLAGLGVELTKTPDTIHER